MKKFIKKINIFLIISMYIEIIIFIYYKESIILNIFVVNMFFTLIISIINLNIKEKEKNLKENKIKNIEYNEKTFYESQIKKLTKTEKIYYDILYKNYHNDFKIETQVYLRSIFPRMKAPNLIIDIVFKTKKTDKPILLVEINDETHNRRKLTKLRDKDLKTFCQNNKIKLQALWTRYDANEKPIINLINNNLKK